MQAVVLAGGLGTRLRPMTESVPKPMVPVGDRPFLEYILRHLAEHGFGDVLVLLGYLGEQIEKYFGDGARLGLRLTYAREQSLLGTAGALRNALAKLEPEFLLLYGDSFLPIDYNVAVKRFRSSDCDGLVVAYQNAAADTGVKHNLAIDLDGYVLVYDKTGVARGLQYAEAGVLCFRREVFAALPAGKAISLENEIYPRLIARRSLRAFVTAQRFFDIGTPERLQEFMAEHA